MDNTPWQDAPGSVRTVAQTLQAHGRLSLKELHERSGLARRTVYGAVRRLEEAGHVRRMLDLRDTRRAWLVLTRDAEGASSA